MHPQIAMDDALARYLDLATQQMRVTASNMANIDTPGYKTQGFDFEQEFASALHGAPSTSAEIHALDGLVSRPDGNNVSMDREAMQMAKTQLQFRAGVELLRSEYSRMMTAIHAEGK